MTSDLSARPEAVEIVDRANAKRSRLLGSDLLLVVLGFQFLSALVFVGQLWSEVLGIRSVPIPWEIQEIIQMLASLGLVSGVVVSAVFLRRSGKRIADLDQQIDVAAGNFQTHMLSTFADWDLSKSEQAVAVFAMKGFSNAEIADLRGTSESTVKTQMNSIFRKSDLSNRQQLISFLVEELLSGVSCEPEEVAKAA